MWLTCESETRGDRVHGMARRQAETVHRGIAYDLEVDTSHSTPSQAAAVVAMTVRDRRVDEVARESASAAE